MASMQQRNAPVAAMGKIIAWLIGRAGDASRVMEQGQRLQDQGGPALLFAEAKLDNLLLNLRQSQTMLFGQKREDLIGKQLLLLAVCLHLRCFCIDRRGTGEFQDKRTDAVAAPHAGRLSNLNVLAIIISGAMNRAQQQRAELAIAVIDQSHRLWITRVEAIPKERRSQAIGQLTHLLMRVAHRQ